MNLTTIKKMIVLAIICLISCNNNPQTLHTNNNQTMNMPDNELRNTDDDTPVNTKYTREDYTEFKRVKIYDRMGFNTPAEAYSILLPADWQSEGGVFWIAPKQPCAGTNISFKAKSADGKFNLQILPIYTWGWTDNPQLNQFNMQSNTGQYCTVAQPIDASQYLTQVLIKEIGNAQLGEVKSNNEVIASMSVNDNKARAEMMQYGAAQVNFRHTAVTADFKTDNNTSGIILCGVSNAETYVPNTYTGGYNINYISTAPQRIIFTFPTNKKEEAEKLLSVIIGNFKTNPEWKETVNGFWKAQRQQNHIEHIGKLKLMDEQTKQIANRAIANGNKRLAELDKSFRSWETAQSSQDKTHSNFIKTIREVENYKDETGVVELSSGYNHTWSRNDGSTFIMSNNSGFNPSSVFQDQRWTEMKKVD